MDPALCLQPGQQELTPAQEAEARRFAEECIQAQLSTEPVNEQEAEALLHQAYAIAGRAPPARIHWLDGPLQLVAVLAPSSVEARVRDSVEARVRDSVWDSVEASVGVSVRDSVGNSVLDSVWASLGVDVGASVRASVETSVRASVEASVRASVRASVEASVRASVGASVEASVRASVRANVWASVRDSVWDSVRAYSDAPLLAHYQFFDEYLAPNDLHALAHFNALVSGYWLGKDTAVLVRRPNVLVRDGVGRLHCATGKCIAYADDWGVYAWHGVRVPEQVIMDPHGLTRDDFLSEPNVEVRRVIQERMGQRFLPELGGMVIDSGPHGKLYEVALPGDPERIACYVQVQDVSTKRQYFLRVPPWMETAAEAVAWSFQVGVEDYDPAQET
jgi:hypothetical protein